ncbi:MAG: NusG domain [Candidatus Aminicenantes bacterium]|nr:NusG domain [Candidatus Aminicenantes bacterium]
MNRRDFVRTLVAPALIWPWTGPGEQGRGEGSLFLLTENPERYIPRLLAELQRMGIVGSRKLSARSAEVQEYKRPSFTAALNGRVIDLRSPGLARLWQAMQREKPSRRLTVIDLAGPGGRGGRGNEVIIKIEGRTIDRLPLGADAGRVYAVRGGRIAVRTSRGAARVEESTCRHGICASSPPISGAGDRIICAPSRFIMEIPGRGAWDTTTG